MRRRDREITSLQELESIIMSADVCRIALAENNIPYIVTMNFGYEGGVNKRLYFHCANEGKKLEMIRKNNFVCFEMDADHKLHEGSKACDFGMSYRSVVGWGHIYIVEGISERINGLDLIMKHYTKTEGLTYNKETLERTTILKLDIQEFTGKIRI